jgi:hypothetical protein
LGCSRDVKGPGQVSLSRSKPAPVQIGLARAC